MHADKLFQQEVHRSWPQAIVFAGVWIPLIGALFLAERQALVVLVPVNLALLYAVGVFVGGFRYRLSTDTLEVRNVFRGVASFPLSEVKSSDVVQTNALADWGGWGVRGWGSSKAYLLGGDQALRLRLPGREVFLGLKNAERLPDRLRSSLPSNVDTTGPASEGRPA